MKHKHLVNSYPQEHPAVTKRTDEEVREFRRKHEMTVFGDNVPKPVTNFEEASVPEFVLKEITSLGFTEPTAIQAQGKSLSWA